MSNKQQMYPNNKIESKISRTSKFLIEPVVKPDVSYFSVRKSLSSIQLADLTSPERRPQDDDTKPMTIASVDYSLSNQSTCSTLLTNQSNMVNAWQTFEDKLKNAKQKPTTALVQVNSAGRVFHLDSEIFWQWKRLRDNCVWCDSRQEYVLDLQRDADVFSALVRAVVVAKSGLAVQQHQQPTQSISLHLPRHLCPQLVQEELKFWQVNDGFQLFQRDTVVSSNCCHITHQSSLTETHNLAELNGFFVRHRPDTSRHPHHQQHLHPPRQHHNCATVRGWTRRLLTVARRLQIGRLESEPDNSGWLAAYFALSLILSLATVGLLLGGANTGFDAFSSSSFQQLTELRANISLPGPASRDLLCSFYGSRSSSGWRLFPASLM